jgi:plasmid maintenance system killer protein
MKIFYTKKFFSLYENLPPIIKIKAEKQERIFKENIFYPSLNTEKLIPKKNNLWSFRVDSVYRVVFHFKGYEATFLYVGHHKDIYKFF